MIDTATTWNLTIADTVTTYAEYTGGPYVHVYAGRDTPTDVINVHCYTTGRNLAPEAINVTVHEAIARALATDLADGMPADLDLADGLADVADTGATYAARSGDTTAADALRDLAVRARLAPVTDADGDPYPPDPDTLAFRLADLAEAIADAMPDTTGDTA